MKKIIINIMLVCGLTSCSDYADVEQYNTDPNNFTDIPGDSNILIGQSETALVGLFGGDASRFSGVFTNQFNGCDRQFVSINNYNVTENDFEGVWNVIYADGYANAQLAQQVASEQGIYDIEGTALMIQGIFMGEAAALFGDVPYSQANQIKTYPDPVFDNQSDVFIGAQSLLDEALTKFDQGSGAIGGEVIANPETSLTGGTAQQLIHSLKARYYLITKDYANALSESKNGLPVNAEWEGLFYSGVNGAQNLYYQFNAERSGYIGLCNTPYLFTLVTDQSARLLSTPGEVERAAVYFNEEQDNLNYTTEGIFAQDSSVSLMSGIETKLIEAEAAYRTGDETTATTAFNEVRAQLATVYGGDFPSTTSSGETLLKEILEEKYISLIGSPEIFHDIRRTNNLLGIPVNSGAALPERFLYSLAELNSNSSAPVDPGLFTKTSVNQ